jgi:hypothetical protein
MNTTLEIDALTSIAENQLSHYLKTLSVLYINQATVLLHRGYQTACVKNHEHTHYVNVSS